MNHIWIVYSVLCALFLSLGDILVKYSSNIHPVAIAAGRILFSLPVLWAIALIKGFPIVNTRILYVLLLSPPLEVIAIVLYMRALQISPLYKTLPLLSFTPLMLILTSWMMLGEKVTPTGIAGILCIVMGTYSIYFAPGQNIIEPLQSITSEKGSMLMIIVAFLYSITANFGKAGIIYSSPYFFSAVYFTILTIILVIWSIMVKSVSFIFSKNTILIGITQGIMITFHMLALEIAPVSYMIAVKRSSLLFGIVFGSICFSEKKLLKHSLSAIIILAGIFIISFTG